MMNVALIKKISMIIISLALLIGSVTCEKEETIGEKNRKENEGEGIVSIATLLEEKWAYKDRIVIISGKTSPGLPFEFVNEQPYLVDDGTAQIWVITTGTMPEEGRWIRVKGRVSIPYQIKGRRYKIALLEIERWQ
jgi:hypothetical protein